MTGTRSALAGFAVWLASIGLALVRHWTGGYAVATRYLEADKAFIQQLLLLGPLVIVPLGLAFCPPEGKTPPHAHRTASVMQLPMALLLVVAMQLEVGGVAGALCGGWLLTTVAVALAAVARLVGRWRAYGTSRALLSLDDLCVDAALVYLPVGALWLLFSRFGKPFLGFGEPIVLLTGVHFHFAGFAAPLVTGLVGRTLRHATGTVPRLWLVAAAGVIPGPMLVAIGFVTTPAIQVVTTVVLATGMLSLSGVTALRLVPILSARLPRALLLVASLALVLTMGLALAYVIGTYRHESLVDIPTMARIHGVANAIGFSLCALVGLRLAGSPRT